MSASSGVLYKEADGMHATAVLFEQSAEFFASPIPWYTILSYVWGRAELPHMPAIQQLLWRFCTVCTFPMGWPSASPQTLSFVVVGCSRHIGPLPALIHRR
jgi:hypothetical protein